MKGRDREKWKKTGEADGRGVREYRERMKEKSGGRKKRQKRKEREVERRGRGERGRTGG